MRELGSFAPCPPRYTETKVKQGVYMGNIKPLMYVASFVGHEQNDFVHAELWRMLLA